MTQSSGLTLSLLIKQEHSESADLPGFLTSVSQHDDPGHTKIESIVPCVIACDPKNFVQIHS